MVDAGIQVSRPGETSEGGEAALEAMLGELYRKQLVLDPDDAYLLEHGQPKAISDHVRNFHWFRPHLPEASSVLDWGCHHAPDACLLRACFGDAIDLSTCDFTDLDRHSVFRDFARSNHTRLSHIFSLPFPDDRFGAVIASGVLEHTAMDYESLKELHRVLKPGGVLAISYLPNRFSYEEWIRRVIRKKDFHLRRYGMGQAIRLLKHSGFEPIEWGYQAAFWERQLRAVGLGRWEAELSRVLQRVLPVHAVSSTLRIVARKAIAF